MKSCAIAVLFSALVCGQPPQPPKVIPGTPAPAPVPVTPAPATPAVPPDAVVAEVDGKKVTAQEVDNIIASLPPQYQQAARLQPQQMLSQVFMFKYLAEEALKANLDKQSPWKDALEFQRMAVLYNAEVTYYRAKINPMPEEQEKQYKEHPDRYKQAKVRVIHISFSPTPDKPGPDGKKLLSEAEAKAKADDLRKRIQAGEDFGKLAREYSDDKASAAKDGDFGAIYRNSPYPEPVKTAVFALKAGEVSEPVKQPNGFYLIRADSVGMQSYEEVRSQIYEELKQTTFNEWLRGLQTRFAVKVDNPGYFSSKQPVQLQPVH